MIASKWYFCSTAKRADGTPWDGPYPPGMIANYYDSLGEASVAMMKVYNYNKCVQNIRVYQLGREPK